MKERKGITLMLIGLLLIVAALLLLISNTREERAADQASTDAAAQIMTYRDQQRIEAMLNAPVPTVIPTGEVVTPVPPDYVLFPDMDMPAVEVNGHTYVGTLEIPVLQLSLPVMSEWSYPKLKLSPCRYSGTAYLDNFVIIAHNYERHFGNIKLLAPGDEVRFTDMAGNVFCYTVAETETLQPNQSAELVESDYALTLLTCTVGGQTRVTVRCTRAEN